MARAEPISLNLDKKLAIVQLSDTDQPMLVRLRQHKRKLYGALQTGSENGRTSEVPILADEILSVFPHTAPRFGKAYNIHIEPLFSTERIDRFGIVHFFRELAATERDNLLKGFRLTYQKFIRPHKLQFLLPMKFEMRNPRGKQIGMYHPPRKDQDHYITLSPISFIGDEDATGPEHIVRIVAHELTHPILNYASDKIKAKWVRLYHAFNQITELTIDDLTRMRTDLVASKLTLLKFRKELEETARLPFDAVIAWIKKVHHLNATSINLLLADGDNLRDYWPRNKLHLSELKIPVTKYSSKDPDKMACESVALYVLRPRNLLRPIRKLVRQTLRAARPK